MMVDAGHIVDIVPCGGLWGNPDKKSGRQADNAKRKIPARRPG